MNLKFLAVASAAFTSFVLHVPIELHKTAGVALWLVICDTLLGLWCARNAGEMSSSAFRKKLHSKLVCYAGILSLAAGMAVFAGSWLWLIAGWYGVMGGEALSMIENLRGIVSTGGPSMAPISAVLDKIGAIFAPKGGTSSNGSTPSDK